MQGVCVWLAGDIWLEPPWHPTAVLWISWWSWPEMGSTTWVYPAYWFLLGLGPTVHLVMPGLLPHFHRQGGGYFNSSS